MLLKEAGQPVEPVYPTEGTPTISGPTGIFKSAQHPNAAKLFQAWLHTRETQQFFIDYTAQYSVHAQVAVETGTPQAFRHQADEGGRCRRRGHDGRDQDALCAVVQECEFGESCLLTSPRLREGRRAAPGERTSRIRCSWRQPLTPALSRKRGARSRKARARCTFAHRETTSRKIAA